MDLLTKQGTHSNPVLKIVFAAIIIVLPVLGFAFGIQYQFTASKQTPSTIKQITTLPERISLPTPTLTPEFSIYPAKYFLNYGGYAYIKDQYTYDFIRNQNFILGLTDFKDSKQNDQNTPPSSIKADLFTVKLQGSVDSLSHPTISYAKKYGCVTVQSSGYVGYYIFDIATGNGVDSGKQYSECVEWVDENRVIARENLYDTPTVTYYLIDASTNQKKVLSSIDIKN